MSFCAIAALEADVAPVVVGAAGRFAVARFGMSSNSSSSSDSSSSSTSSLLFRLTPSGSFYNCQKRYTTGKLIYIPFVALAQEDRKEGEDSFCSLDAVPENY